MIYLDNAATTFPKPDEVLNAVDLCQRTYAVNVGRGSYPLARQAAECVDETRRLMAELVHANSSENVVFVSSATMAANEIIMGLPWDSYKVVYVSPFEHNAVIRPLYRICFQYGIEMKILPFDSTTQEWDANRTVRMFEKDRPDYVFVSHVSNVTGVVLPIHDIAEKAKQYGACVIIDASQSLGCNELDLRRDDADYVIWAGHKNLYASWGIGGFIANAEKIKPVFSGGTGSDSLNPLMRTDTPYGFEAGSPNIIAIASLNASLKWIRKTGREHIAAQKFQLMQRLISGLTDAGVSMYLPTDRAKHSGVLSFNLDSYSAEETGTILGEDYGIAVRTGYHCAPFVHDLISTREIGGTVRVGVGYFNTDEDIDALIKAVRELQEE